MIEDFEIRVEDAVLDDLHHRLTQTRYPDQIDGTGWDYGIPVDYLRRHVEKFDDEAPFVSAILSGERVYAVLSADDYRTLAPQIASRTCIIDHRPTFEVKLRQVLARQPLPELLLISNRCN